MSLCTALLKLDESYWKTTARPEKKRTQLFVNGFPIATSKLKDRCVKRPIGRNDLHVSKLTKRCNLQYIRDAEATKYCNLQYIRALATNFRRGRFSNTEIEVF